MPEKVSTEEVYNAYESVRKDDSVQWASYEYDDDNNITVVNIGEGFDGFKDLCKGGFFIYIFLADNRVYGYVKFTTGDEMSKRTKFAFITWVGESVSPLKKAQVSTDKALVKKVVQNFAIEVHANTKDELSERTIVQTLIKAGGANYGTGGNR